MKEIKIIPDGWECLIEECPPGFFYYKGQLCFKTEYFTEEEMEVYCDSGETFMPRKIMVQPVIYEETDDNSKL